MLANAIQEKASIQARVCSTPQMSRSWLKDCHKVWMTMPPCLAKSRAVLSAFSLPRGDPVYPARPQAEGGRFRAQPGWPCLWPQRGDPSTLAARSLEMLVQIEHRARRLLGGAVLVEAPAHGSVILAIGVGRRGPVRRCGFFFFRCGFGASLNQLLIRNRGAG